MVPTHSDGSAFFCGWVGWFLVCARIVLESNSIEIDLILRYGDLAVGSRKLISRAVRSVESDAWWPSGKAPHSG
jgi:hypothetical protein